METSEGTTLVEFIILGKTQLLVDGREVDLGAQKQRGLLALLLLYAGRPVGVETIIGQLWPGRSRTETRGNLQSLVSRLRGVLRAAGVPHDLPYEGDTYRLALNPLLVDYHHFRTQVEAGRTAARAGDHTAAKTLLRDAVKMWQGPPLADLRTEWADQRREQMQVGDLLPAYYALIDSELELREFSNALHHLRPLMDDYPLDETLAKQWMLAVIGLGRYNDATSFFAQFRQRFVSELGTDPAPELREAYRQVLLSRASPSTAQPIEAVPAPQQLPRAVGQLAGREALLAALDALLPNSGPGKSARVVALHGMPGVGKTSLATYWAHRRQDDFPDGQLFLNLHGYGLGRPIASDDALAMFLDALGVPADLIPPTGDQRAARLNRMVSDRRVLFVLDNVRDSAHARPLLSATPGSPVLVTSRARLSGLAIRDGVDSYVVPPLSPDESVELLLSEIGDSRAADDPPAVRALAELSGGLPLALKIIGHHVANRPRTRLADVVRELDGCTGLVTSVLGGDDEMATLPGAFSLSYHALPYETARLFRLLGMHPGPRFSSHAASALFGHDLGTTEQHLKTLTTLHLLEPDGLYRHRLHDLLHAYAADRAQSEEPADQRIRALTRLMSSYLGTATNAHRLLAPHSPPVPPTSLDTNVTPLVLETDQDAIRWCHEERENLIAATRCAAERGLHRYAWRLPATMWEAFERSGTREDFLQVLPLALDSARVLGDRQAEIGMLNVLGRAYFCRRNFHLALRYFEEGATIAAKIGEARLEGASRHNVACARLELGQISTALGIYHQTLQLHRQIGVREGEAHSLHRLGDVNRRLGQYEKAVKYYQEALSIRQAIGHLRGQGDTLAALGELYYEQDAHDQAREYCLSAMKIHERSHDNVRAIDTLITLATIQHNARLFSESAELARHAVELCLVTRDSRARGRALQARGSALLALGDHAAAQESLIQALAIFEVTGDLTAATTRSQLSKIDAEVNAVPRPRADKTTRLPCPLLDSVQ